MAMLHERPLYRIMGDRALLVELGEVISPPVNRAVRRLFLGLEQRRPEGVADLVPGYRSLLITYDPLQTSFSALQATIAGLQETLGGSPVPLPKTLRIPVVYGGKYGPDLEWVAGYHGTSPEEIVRIHTQSTYQVYMIGFTPGFPYMGELPESIATPRRDSPRTAVPAGSVAIAQRQTGIYPVESPGGWQLIGRTPIKFFDPRKRPPTPLEMGDLVEFFPITEEEMAHWEP
jgi:inhibitor of KinA